MLCYLLTYLCHVGAEVSASGLKIGRSPVQISPKTYQLNQLGRTTASDSTLKQLTTCGASNTCTSLFYFLPLLSIQMYWMAHIFDYNFKTVRDNSSLKNLIQRIYCRCAYSRCVCVLVALFASLTVSLSLIVECPCLYLRQCLCLWLCP